MFCKWFYRRAWLTIDGKSGGNTASLKNLQSKDRMRFADLLVSVAAQK